MSQKGMSKNFFETSWIEQYQICIHEATKKKKALRKSLKNNHDTQAISLYLHAYWLMTNEVF